MSPCPATVQQGDAEQREKEGQADISGSGAPSDGQLFLLKYCYQHVYYYITICINFVIIIVVINIIIMVIINLVTILYISTDLTTCDSTTTTNSSSL